MNLLLVLYISIGILLALLSIPLIWRWIPPNGWYGFRIRQTLENPQLWYEVNAFAGRRLFLTGFAIALGALLFYLVPGFTLEIYALCCLAVTLAGLGLTILQSARYLRKIGRK